ncbi:MAG: FAD-binding oxidoreductase, partial [Firmicutes bacterium]|nr:FAD-binding oxidoreductase [Bacillota bacterium]
MRIYPFTEEYALYLRDESRSVGEAAWICFPVCEEDVREALSFAREKDLCVTTQGGRTGLAAGCVPHGGLVLNLSRMDRVLGAEREGDAVLLRTQPG